MRGSAAGLPASVDFLREFRQWGMVVGDRLVGRLKVAGVDQVQTYALKAALLKLQRLSGPVGKVDNPAGNDRTTIVHTKEACPTIVQVRDPHIAPHGKFQVSRRHIVHIIGLAAGGGLTVENLTIPRRSPNLIGLRLDYLWAD